MIYIYIYLFIYIYIPGPSRTGKNQGLSFKHEVLGENTGFPKFALSAHPADAHFPAHFGALAVCQSRSCLRVAKKGTLAWQVSIATQHIYIYNILYIIFKGYIYNIDSMIFNVYCEHII